MENKRKTKLFIIIMSLFLVATFVGTCSLTLSFFGSSGSGSTTIRLGNAVTVENTVTLSTANLYVLPSQKVVVSATATVKSEGSSTPTPALLRAKVTVDTTLSDLSITPGTSLKVDGANVYWVKGSDDYYYLMSSNSATGTLYTIDPGTSGKAIAFDIGVLFPESLKNTDNSKTCKVSVVFCAIQGRIYNADGTTLLQNTIPNTQGIFNTVEGY
mgnify:CR=1 FL=1